MPAFVEMERNHGSLIRALQSKPSRDTPNQPAAIFTTLRYGMSSLVERLIATLPPQWLRLNTSITAIQPPASKQTPWTVLSRTGRHLGSDTFDAVFLATPLDVTRQLLAPIEPEAATLLPTSASSAVLVAFCYPDASRVPLPPGFGFLVPPTQSAEQALNPSTNLLLACTFVDQKFPHRVPPNGRIIRAFFGGAAADRLTRCNNDETAAIARLELARALNGAAPISAPAPAPAPPPVLTVVRRWPNSLPQYEVGHVDRIAELESRLTALPGLTLLGNALHGVGVPDLIHAARKAAQATATEN
jgi:oxygen-dependent protoporphyrinogen oxidase